MANILILYSELSRVTGTVADHLDAFKKYSSHTFAQLDSRALSSFDVDFDLFDCIVFHYSIVISSQAYISKKLTKRLEAFSGLKMLYIQDEMRWVNRTSQKIKQLNITTVFTVVNKEVVRDIYKDSWFDNVRFEFTLTGFVPEDLVKREVVPYENRNLDVSYRARKLPAWCGFFGQEKWLIADKFEKDAEGYGLNCDVSCDEAARIYGDDWIKFVENSKATLGVESGASFIDYTGEIAPAIDEFEARYPMTPFEVVRDKFLDGRDGDVKIQVISPRCFEAAALRTLMVMYEGDYSGVFKANRHYVPLARDHSNMDEVVSVIRNPKMAKTIIDCAYQEIACSEKWTFKSAINQFDGVVDDELLKVGRSMSPAFSDEQALKLESACLRLTKRYKRNLAIAQSLSFATTASYEFLDRHLPKAIRKPVLQAAGFITRPVKKLLSRILFG